MHNNPIPASVPFEMVRLTHAKREVDLAPNTIRKFHREFGLNIYWMGKIAFFSRTELVAIIREVSSSEPAKPHRQRVSKAA